MLYCFQDLSLIIKIYLILSLHQSFEMHQFFAIVKATGSDNSINAHKVFWEKIKTKFPIQFSKAKFHSDSLLDIWGIEPHIF